MILKRMAAFAALLVILFLLGGCGQTYRPIITPINNGGPDPQTIKVAVVVTTNGASTDGSTANVDLSGDTNVGQVSMGRGPVHAAIFLNQSRVMVANRDEDSVSLFNTFAPLVPNKATISLPSGAAPSYLFTNQAGTLYAIFSGHDSLGIIDLTLNLFKNEVVLGAGANPSSIIGTSDGKKIYVANKGLNTVSVFETAGNTKTSDIAVGTQPVWMAINADQSRVYVVNQGSNNVSVITTSNDTVAATLPVGTAPNYAIFDPKLLRVYVTNPGSNSVSIINADPLSTGTAGFQTVTNVTVGSTPVSVTALSDGTRAYVANSGDNTVSVINTLSYTVKPPIPVGKHPLWISSSGDSIKVIVANRDSNNVSLIRTSDDTVSVNLAMPGSPVFMLVAQ